MPEVDQIERMPTCPKKSLRIKWFSGCMYDIGAKGNFFAVLKIPENVFVCVRMCVYSYIIKTSPRVNHYTADFSFLFSAP